MFSAASDLGHAFEVPPPVQRNALVAVVDADELRAGEGAFVAFVHAGTRDLIPPPSLRLRWGPYVKLRFLMG